MRVKQISKMSILHGQLSKHIENMNFIEYYIFQVQIRLPDGSRLVAPFNIDQNVSTIRNFVVSARPELAFQEFHMMTTFPNKVLPFWPLRVIFNGDYLLFHKGYTNN